MRWFTNNVAVKVKPDGNKEYIKKMKIEEKPMGSWLLFTHYIEQTISVRQRHV